MWVAHLCYSRHSTPHRKVCDSAGCARHSPGLSSLKGDPPPFIRSSEGSGLKWQLRVWDLPLSRRTISDFFFPLRILPNKKIVNSFRQYQEANWEKNSKIMKGKDLNLIVEEISLWFPGLLFFRIWALIGRNRDH